MSRLDGILNSVAATQGLKSLRPERVRSSNRQDEMNSSGTRWHSLDFQDDVNHAFADEAEADAKKQRVTYTATNLVTGSVQKREVVKSKKRTESKQGNPSPDPSPRPCSKPNPSPSQDPSPSPSPHPNPNPH